MNVKGKRLINISISECRRYLYADQGGMYDYLLINLLIPEWSIFYICLLPQNKEHFLDGDSDFTINCLCLQERFISLHPVKKVNPASYLVLESLSSTAPFLLQGGLSSLYLQLGRFIQPLSSSREVYPASTTARENYSASTFL